MKQVVYKGEPGSRGYRRQPIKCNICRRSCRSGEAILRINEYTLLHRSCMEDFLARTPSAGTTDLRRMTDEEAAKAFAALRRKLLRQVREGKMVM